MITFILNNKKITTDNNAGMTLLDFVRYEQRLTGTKIGCREGDCGACTVLVGTLKNNGHVEYKSVTSCISPLGNAHGKHIVTIEGINLQNELTVAQEAMKANYATQCGFCTPGFIMSLTSVALSNSNKSYNEALNAISGNICRCTGYKSIEKAAKEFCQQLDHTIDVNGLITHNFIPAYFSTIPDRLKNVSSKETTQTDGAFVAGGTDLYVQQADNLIDNTVHLIANYRYLNKISIQGDWCKIGSGNTVSDLWNYPEMHDFFPKLKKHLKLVSSEQIRNMASFGGNLVNASPIGDMTIFFLALNSNLLLIDQNKKERTLPLNKFYTAYKTFDLKDGELIKSIDFKLPTKHTYFNFEKVSKRTYLDIASVNSACCITLNDHIISEAHISIGGVAAIPKYLHKTSSFLVGKSLNHQLIIDANQVLQNEIAPISDVRGSSDYKRLLARQLFFAHFTELFADKINLTELVPHA